MKSNRNTTTFVLARFALLLAALGLVSGVNAGSAYLYVDHSHRSFLSIPTATLWITIPSGSTGSGTLYACASTYDNGTSDVFIYDAGDGYNTVASASAYFSHEYVPVSNLAPGDYYVELTILGTPGTLEASIDIQW